MTLFEYVAVAASLLCSFSAAHLLGGLAAALRPDRRYWVHALWVFNLVFGITLAWWLAWSYRDVDWDYFRFLMALAPLAILYVISTVLIPTDAESVSSWRHRYEAVRVRLFALNLAYLAASLVNTVVLLGQPILHPQHVLLSAFAVLFAVGLATRRPRVHAAIVLVFTAFNAVASVVALRPGAFGASP